MSQIKLTVDEKFIDDLKKETGVSQASQLTDDAFILFKWAINEAKKGRVLISVNADGTDPKKMVMDTLENVK